MRSKAVFLGLLLTCFFPFVLQGQSKALYDFSLLRQNDDIDTLKAIPQGEKDLYQRLKLVKLSENAAVSFGGSWRFQLESFENQKFVDAQNGNKIWILNRFMTHSHLHWGKLEVFGELVGSFTNGKDDLSPVDVEELAVNQLFAKYRLTPELKLGIGRENLKLGSGRVVDPREGPAVRRSFDMVQAQFKKNNFSALAFFGATGNVQPGVFDNNYLDFNETFSTLYTTTKLNAKNAIDAYVMYQKDNDIEYSNVSGDERRAMLGVRHFGDVGFFTFNNEFFYQFGNVADQTISAWSVTVNLEKAVKIGSQDCTIGIKSSIISGDTDANDKVTNTFDPFYPRGAYFGRVASFTPSNFYDIHPYINTNFGKFFVEVDYDAFWRYSVHDALYNPSVRIEFEDLNDARFIAHQIGAIAGYKPNNFLNLELESNIICPGAFLEQSGRDKTLVHLVFTAEFTF